MIRRALTLSLAICLQSLAALSQTLPSSDSEEYASAIKNVYIDHKGHVHIVQINGKQVEPAPEPDQFSSGSALIASDKLTVGWLVWSLCCKSPKDTAATPLSPFPIHLIIYKQGKIINSFEGGPEAMITDWHFLANGKEVSFCTEVIWMNSNALSCERVALGSSPKEDVIESWDSWSGKPMPAWAKKDKQ